MVTHSIKEPYQADPEFARAVHEYMTTFGYSIQLRLGPSHSDKFKDFHAWCREHLGTQYRDWFIMNHGPGIYTLRCKDNKWAMFLALSWVDIII